MCCVPLYPRTLCSLLVLLALGVAQNDDASIAKEMCRESFEPGGPMSLLSVNSRLFATVEATAQVPIQRQRRHHAHIHNKSTALIEARTGRRAAAPAPPPYSFPFAPPGFPINPNVLPSAGQYRAELQRRAKAHFDCIVSPWSDWTDCARFPKDVMDAPMQSRMRQIVQPQLPGGKPCPSLNYVQYCW